MNQSVQWRWVWLLIALMVVLPGGARAQSTAWPAAAGDVQAQTLLPLNPELTSPTQSHFAEVLSFANMQGEVKGAMTHQLIPGAKVAVLDLGLETVTSDSGLFSFTPIALAGTMIPITVTVTAPGYGVWQYSNLYLIANDTLILDVNLEITPISYTFTKPRAELGGCQLNTPLPQLTPQMIAALQGVSLPETIRVGRQSSGWPNCQGGTFTQVDVVSFKYYVKHVLPKEWIASWPAESLRAGAMAVKMYAWYFISIGGKWKNHNPPADVMDSTCDQVYDPTVSYASTDAAVDATWDYVMLRNNSLFPIHYCATCTACSFCSCGQDCMGQWESKYRADEGKSWQQILQMYYAGIEIQAIDQIAPTTAHALSGAAGENGWYVSAVQVTLAASDNSGGSGVKLTQYRMDGGTTQTYGGPFTVSGDGSHTVYYQSQDNAGNWEAEKAVTFNIDTLAPAAPTTAAAGCTAVHNTWQHTCADPIFTCSGASDATSGLAGYQLYWGSDPNGTSDYWTGSPTFDPGAPGEGTYYFRARAKDNAGNWSGWVTLFTFRYDATAPTGALTVNQNASVTYATLVRLSPTGSDALSGLAEVRFRDAGGAWSAWVPFGTTLWQLPGPTGQTFSVEMQVRDRAGNESAVYADNIALNIYPARPASAGYRLARSTWGAAAVERSSAGYRLLSTLGQPSMIGSLTSASYRLTSGYWAGYRPLRQVYLPLVLRNR